MYWWIVSSTNKRLIEKSRLTTAMRRSFIILCVISRVSLEMQTVHHFYMALKERPNSLPIHTEYIYNQIKNHGSTISSSDKDREKSSGYKKKRQLADPITKKIPECSSESNNNEYTSEKPLTTVITKKIDTTEIKKHPPKHNVLLKEIENELNNILPAYEKQDFLYDEEDVRTDSKNLNDVWPLFYQSSYEYEPMTYDNEVQKAQDKRFIIPEDHRVIPVHEHIKDDTVDSQLYSVSDLMQTTDNPVLGDQPFFSYVLNDYFDKTDDEDPFTFKGLSWGKDFDQELSFQDIDDYAKRIRRLEDDASYKKVYGDETELNKGSLHLNKQGDIYDSKQKLEGNTKENKNKRQSHLYHNYDEENIRGFKNFADYFANRFGTEDHNKSSEYNVKNNVDKGEKKKGFRNVYHKDEYQEQTEFYDNNDKKVDFEDKGKSKIHIGGLETISNSQAALAAGNDKSRLTKSEDNERQKIKRNNKSEHQKRDYNNFSRYRDVAKNAVLSNNADYIDRFLT